MANALPLLLVAGAAAVAMGGKKKRSKAPSCPPEVSVTFTPEMVTEPLGEIEFPDGTIMEVRTVRQIKDQIDAGLTDPMKIADGVLAQTLPAGCTKANKDTMVAVTNENQKVGRIPIPAYYFAMVGESVEALIAMKKMTMEESKAVADSLVAWWKQLMGDISPMEL